MKKFLLTLLSAAAIISCDDKEATSLGPNNTIVGFPVTSNLNSFLNDIPDAEVNIVASLMSYENETLPSQDITLTWSIVDPADYLDPADFADQAAYDAELATFATSGNEFEAPAGGSGTAVIVAGQTMAALPAITVHPVNFPDPDAPKKFVIRLMEATNAVVGNQYKDVVVILQGICASDLAGNYDLVCTRLDTGTIYNMPGEVFEADPSVYARYSGNSIGPYNDRGAVSAGAQIAGVGLVFDEICGKIALWQDPDWTFEAQTGVPDGTAQFLGPYYNAVYQDPTSNQFNNSTVDPVTGVVTIEYNIWFSAGTRPYRGVYTPQ